MSGLCAFFDTVCMSGSQRFIVDRIGPGHDIFIPHINHWYKNEWAIPWNRELDRLVGERANVHTWAWDVELATGGYDLDDVVHLTPDSYRRWSVLAADEITAALGRPTFPRRQRDAPRTALACWRVRARRGGSPGRHP